jgi:ribonuclease VapC
MVIDTSALIAIALGEPSRGWLLELLKPERRRALSSISLLEAGIILRARLGSAAPALLYQLVEELASEVVPFDDLQARMAVAAFGRFAQLNFGDCAVYALAAFRSEPVLATGNDFTATDVPVCRP